MEADTLIQTQAAQIFFQLHTTVPHGGISFGTNDLTQTALGMSRDDTGSFPPGCAVIET